MKTIAIISAMQLEINPLIKKLKAKEIEKDIWESTIFNKQILLAVSGIGKTNISCFTTFMHLKFGVKKIINIGVAGSLSNDLKPFDIIAATNVAHYDFDLRKFGHAIGQVPGYEQFFQTHNISYNKIISGLIVSGDKFVEAKDVVEIKKYFPKAIAVDMESASFAQTAEKLNMVYSIIRIISDNGLIENNAMQYEANKHKASKLITSVVIEAIRKL